MPRQARQQSPTGYYHVMLRGNNRDCIFSKDEQKNFFLDSLRLQNEEQLIDIAAYCLMDNHVHIVVKTNPVNMAKAFKSICTKYAMNFNRQKDKIGHVFQDRYKSEAVNDDKYLVQVIRYVHNNPVKAKMVKLPEGYKWSSYNEYTQEVGIIGIPQKELVLGFFSNNINQFMEFHKQRDDHEYLDMKEDLNIERFEKAQDIISEYFQSNGLTEAKQVFQNPVHMEEIIKDLLKKSRLTHRQIAHLIGVSSSAVHRTNLGG